MPSARILIVEDEAIVALDLQARLRKIGYESVGTASSGQEAIRLAEITHPDLALMDIRLSGDMDGIEAAQQLRVRFDIPVVYLTAYTDEPTLQRARVTEPFGYLIKPLEEHDLRSTIEMALHKIVMDRKLRVQMARLNHIITTIPEGVVLLDADHRAVLANDKAREYLAVLTSAGIGDILKTLGEFSIDELLIPVPGKNSREVTVAGSPQRVFEVSAVSTYDAPMLNAQVGLSPEYLVVMRDVTEERETLQRSQLQDRLAAVGQLAAGIAHDFNNILTSITLSIYSISKLEPNLSPQVQDRLDMLSRQARRASDLIKQVLDFSRASVMEMKVFDLVPLTKELTKMLERVLPENIKLELILQPGNYMICGDATRILQLLMNLALNARDAMPGGGAMRIDLARCAAEDCGIKAISDRAMWIRIRVSDQGTGIHPDDLPHVFEPFFTTKGPDKGTGLGLSQVHGIVQQHKGHVSVDSHVGNGTTFSIYLPAHGSLSPKDTGSEIAGSIPLAGTHQTVLVVEDDASVRQGIGEILSLANYHVLTASNGLEALALLETSGTPVDLILSDLAMPKMGGLELCRELRRTKTGLRLIVITGYVAEEALRELKSLGVTDFLTKPIEIPQLLCAVETALLKVPL